MDALRLVLLAVAFGVLVTAQVALVAALAMRRPRYRALVSFFVPPLAPYWGWQDGHRVASSTWLVALVAYGVLLFVAAR